MEQVASYHSYQQIAQTFFSLIYNDSNTYEDLKNFEDSALFDKISKESLDFYTIILICNHRNFDIYQQLPLIQEKIQYLLQEPLELRSVQKLQFAILHLLVEQNSLKMAEDIIRRITLVRSEGILEYDEEQKIRSVIRQIRPQSKVIKPLNPIEESEQDYLKHKIQYLITFMNDFKDLLIAHGLGERADYILQVLQGGRFSIGVTGVMSAGKSTLLNALLSREILGASVVPETANLTVLRYSLQEKCVVHFWTQQEWENIQKSSQFNEGIARFIEETQNHFGDSLKEHIKTDGLAIEIPVNELTFYTSAKNTSKMCNLIKYVDLYLPLEFLKDGVELVDTPGLDDPLTQREEITKDYLLHCDVIMHLMNAAQSATQKDLDFVIDALVNKHISSVFIVLTHADTVSQKDLEAVMEYTKTSFQNRLRELQISENFEKIVQQIEFLPTAGYMALLHRIGRSNEALEKGYKLEDTGIFQVESYLNKILFGENSQKGKVILCNACRESLDLFQKILSEIQLQRSLLYENKEDIQQRIHDNEIAQREFQEKLQNIQAKIQNALESFEVQVQLLKKGARFKILEYEEIVKDRILNLLRYAYEHQTKVNAEPLQKSITIGIQDGATEAKRDFCYKLERAVHFLLEENKESIYSLANTRIEAIDQKLAEVQEQISLFLSQTPFIDQTSVLQQGVVQLSTQNFSLSSVKPELDKVFAFAFDVLVQRTEVWTTQVQEQILDRINQTLQAFYVSAQNSFQVERDVLMEILKERENQSVDDYEKKLLFEEEKLLGGKVCIEQILKEVL